MKKNNKEEIINVIALIIYVILNFILLLYHEQWRDEAHSWLMPKYLSIKELFIESRFDGHPILWHLILMPFSKLGFPYITNQIISLIIMSISAYLFLFKFKINNIFKLVVLFTIPFMYVYSVVARNYCLIVLLLILIAIFYKKRYEKPIIYSVLIALLVHTHSLAWGIVAGLTITFHFYELIINYNKYTKKQIINILFGLIIIIFSTLLVIYELFGKENAGYQAFQNSKVNLLMLIMIIILIITFIFNKYNKKEWMVLLLGYAFNAIIYYFVYSSIITQRYMLVFVYFLFYILLLINNVNNEKCEKNGEYINILYVLYLLIMIICGVKNISKEIINDVKYPYSSAKEMAIFINENLSKEDIILVDTSIITQSIGAYLDKNILYDFCKEKYVGCAEESVFDVCEIFHNTYKLYKKNEYKGKYVIISNDLIKLNFKKVYETKKSIQNEYFTLYYIE